MAAAGSSDRRRPRRSSARPDALTHRVLEAIRRAFAQFLTIPTALIALFMAMAAASYVIDEMRIAQAGEAAGLFGTRLFSDPEKSADLLGAIATSIITVTSITFSLLLIAVQQGAATLTSQIFDQFLRRKINQVYFGCFIGLALYCLIILATITDRHNPTYGVAFAFLMTIVALYMLTLLIYQTIDQMRPVAIIGAISDYTMAARDRQHGLLRSTRRAPRLRGTAFTPVNAETGGFLAHVSTDLLGKAASELGCEAEIAILVSIGDYVSFGDRIAEIRVDGDADASGLREAALVGLRLEAQRDLDFDPAFGIEQLTMIGWTTTSTAKSNPEPGLLACWKLRDILAHWLDAADHDDSEAAAAGEKLPVVYVDNVPERAIKAFESLAVVASESMQHQTVAEIYRAFAILFPRLPADLRDQAEDVLLRSLSALGDHVPTSELDAALSVLVAALRESGRSGSAEAVEAAQGRLDSNIGVFRSRATRAEDRTGQ